MNSRAALLHLALAILALTTPLGPSRALWAQQSEVHIARGDVEMAALRPAQALAQFDSAIAFAPDGFDALWRAAQAAAELAEFEESASNRARLFGRAEDYARRALRADSTRVEGLFAAARVLGLMARVERAQGRRAALGAEAYVHARDCLRVAPKHPGCLHALGAWHGTVAALNPFLRRMAGVLTNSGAFGRASWEEAERLLNEAVQEEPKRIAHRLELARVYAARNKRSAAKEQLRAAISGDVMDSNDDRRKEAARRELERRR